MLSPKKIASLFSLSDEDLAFLSESKSAAQSIASGKDPRKALIIGPCSIHDRNSALEYARYFKELSIQVRDSCFLVMRVYLEKSRTSTGWKGLIYDPHLDGSNAIDTGLLWARELFTELVKMRVPVATEFVDPILSSYFQDLITWGFIGARTTTSQPHRSLASSLDIPVGFKNTVSGGIQEAVEGAYTASIPHTFLTPNVDGFLSRNTTLGNPYCHIVLRGSKSHINYDPSSIEKALTYLESHGLFPHLLIDCAHGNSQKSPQTQVLVLNHILPYLTKENSPIFGVMIESYLKEGSQSLNQDPTLLDPAISVTDPCIDWNTTQDLILTIHDSLSTSMRLTQS